MAKNRPKTLPPMGQPYEGIKLLLQIVGRNNPNFLTLDKLILQNREDVLTGLQYYHGKDDILFFCMNKLNLFEFDNDHFRLTLNGQELYDLLYTGQFDLALFKYLFNCAHEHFTYFYDVCEAIRTKAENGELTMSVPLFNTLIVDNSNRRSNKEIRGLLIGCKAVRIQDNDVVIDPNYFLVDAKQDILQSIWKSVSQILQEEGRLLYEELLLRLKVRYPDCDWNELEDSFRDGLVLSKTRATEHVDGVRSATHEV